MVLLGIGWVVGGTVTGFAGVDVKEELSGTVAVVNGTGSKICLTPTGSADQRCGVVYQRPDAPSLAVGDRVTIAVAALRVADGTQTEIFLIEFVAH